LSYNLGSTSYFWLDYETYGVRPQVDRPCQFAGIRTDMDLNIISEPLELYCKPIDDYLPSAEACLVHGITPQFAEENGVREVEFISRIHQELSTPNTCVVGYNNLRFDDEITRFSLYRNFIDPYGWSYKNENSRWDIVDVLRSCYALRPEGLKWPFDNDKPVFKLDRLTVENGIEHSNAHDAMADVHATIAMARLVKKHQPKLFSYLFDIRNKHKLRDIIGNFSGQPLIHVSGKFGSYRGNISWVLPVAQHPTNNNAIICIDLARNPEPLFSLSAEQLKERLYTKYADLKEDELPVPVKLIHLNKCPVLAPAKMLTPENALRLGIDREQCLENWRKLTASDQYQQKLIDLYSIPRTFEVPKDVDQMLYDGFFSPSDRQCFDRIRNCSPQQLSDIDTSSRDPRITSLLFRYRARNYPATLSKKEREHWAKHCKEKLLPLLPEYIEGLKELKRIHSGNTRNQRILDSLQHYVDDMGIVKNQEV
jgi:exodeoxyribonuclease I